jgi:hypothetical protein
MEVIFHSFEEVLKKWIITRDIIAQLYSKAVDFVPLLSLLATDFLPISKLMIFAMLPFTLLNFDNTACFYFPELFRVLFFYFLLILCAMTRSD